jgi:hypothetical protein
MKKYKVQKGYITQKIGNKITIFDGEESRLITLNETATYIFERLKRGLDEGKIIELLSKKYKIEPKRISKDFSDLISELKRLKVVS